MTLLYISKGDYVVASQDILDTIAGAVFADGNIRWKAGTAHYGILTHANTADQTYTFPNASGIVALLSNPQVWTGAQSYNTQTLQVFDVVGRGTTLQLFEASSLGLTRFVKVTMGSIGSSVDDVFIIGGTYGSNRSITVQLQDTGSLFNISAGGVAYISADIQNSRFSPIDNTLSNGASGRRWTAVWAVNGTIQTSFSWHKKDIQIMPSSKCLEIAKAIDPIFFNWKDSKLGDKKQFGIKADALIKMLPEAIASEEDGVFDRSLIAVLYGAVQELDKRLKVIENNS